MKSNPLKELFKIICNGLQMGVYKRVSLLGQFGRISPKNVTSKFFKIAGEKRALIFKNKP